MKESKLKGLFEAVLMTALSFIWVIPLLWSVSMAFRPPDDVYKPLLAIHQLTLQNFANAWHEAPFGLYYLSTIIIVAGILLAQLITSVLAAYAFARLAFLGKSFFFLLLMLQLMIPIEALIAPSYSVIADLHLIDTKWAVMMPHFASAFSIFLLRQTFMQIPLEFDEAAHMEGAKWWHILPRIYVPSAKPTLLALALTVGSYNWNNYLWPLIVTDSAQNRPLTVGLATFAASVESGVNWSEVSAGMLFVAAPLILAFIIFQKQFINSFLQAGIK